MHLGFQVCLRVMAMLTGPPTVCLPIQDRILAIEQTNEYLLIQGTCSAARPAAQVATLATAVQRQFVVMNFVGAATQPANCHALVRQAGLVCRCLRRQLDRRDSDLAISASAREVLAQLN